MSVLVFAEQSEGKFKKTALEVVSYGKELANGKSTDLVVLTINAGEVSPLADYGADKILKVQDERLETFSARAYADCISQAATQASADVIIVDSSSDGLYLAPILAVKLEAGFAANVMAQPESLEPFVVKRKAFSSKGFNFSEINTPVKLIGLAKNSFGLKESPGSASEEDFQPELKEEDFAVKATSTDKSTGTVTIADADIVVSAGRGLKGPENWGMVEELADILPGIASDRSSVALGRLQGQICYILEGERERMWVSKAGLFPMKIEDLSEERLGTSYLYLDMVNLSEKVR